MEVGGIVSSASECRKMIECCVAPKESALDLSGDAKCAGTESQEVLHSRNERLAHELQMGVNGIGYRRTPPGEGKQRYISVWANRGTIKKSFVEIVSGGICGGVVKVKIQSSITEGGSSSRELLNG